MTTADLRDPRAILGILIVAAMVWLAVGMGASTISQILWGHF